MMYIMFIYLVQLQVVMRNQFWPNEQLQQFTIMIKIQSFCGAVFPSKEYGNILCNNIENLETTPMSKTFVTSDMIASGILHLQPLPAFYIYKQVYRGHTSYGVLAEVSLEDYHNNKIKKHEKTLYRPGFNYKTYILDHVGPVVLSHCQSKQLDQMILSLTKEINPYTEWKTNDDRLHTLWRITKIQPSLQSMFASIEALYILDGHHRLEAAHQNYNINSKTNQTNNWIQALIYSSSYVSIYPQHRIIQKLPKNIDIIHELMKNPHINFNQLVIENTNTFNINIELKQYQIILKLYQKFFGINFKRPSSNVLEKIITFRLQHDIFNAFLEDKVLQNMKYVSGIIAQEQIFKNEIVFFVREPTVENLFQIADESVIMPPKSTWIEPKPCSHMVVRILNPAHKL